MIALGSDHGGWALKQEVMKHLDARGLEYKDYGTYSENILAMGARVVGPGLALKIVDTFLDTPFSGDERHVRRIKQIED